MERQEVLMRLKKIIQIIIIFTIFSYSSSSLFSRDSYENYRENRNKNEIYDTKERPLSEVRTGDNVELLDDLRGAVREEIDQTMSRERKASKKIINKNILIRDVRSIIRQEIEEAIRIKEKSYLKPGTFEVGGFMSFQSKGLSGSSADNNYRLKLFPLANYFLTSNFALGIKGEADINLTTSSHNYYIGVGPQFAFGLNRDDTICFYTTVFAGMSYNGAASKSIGFRYGNEIGLKFILTSGVILNAGVMILFDNSGDNVTGFQNLYVPTIGITAWF